MDTKIERQSSVSDADQQPLAMGESEGVRVVAMCTFEAVQDYELGFRQYDVLTAIAKAEEDPSWWVGQIGGKIGLFPSECVEILKGYPDRLPLFKIFLSDDGTDGGIDVLISNDDIPVHQQRHISPSASTASLVSSSSSTEVDTTPRQRASTHPEPDVAVVSCYRCNAQVSIKKGQSFYPCECGANVKRPEVDDEHQNDQEETPPAVNTKRRRCNTAGAAVGGVVREETPKQRKKREKLEREQKKKQDEEERKFRERRDKGRLSASQWNRQVDSARERLWRASVIVTGPNGESSNDDGSSMLSTDDNISTVGSSAFDVDTFEDARSDSPRDISSFSSALSGRSLSRSGSLTSMSVNPESAKTKRDKKKTTKTTKEQRKKEKEEKKRLKKLEKEEREEKRKMERMGREKKRRNSLFGSSSGSIATRKQRDKLTTTANPAAAADSVTVTINPITAHAKKQQKQMKAKTMVKTKSGKVMSLEEVEREGKKSNWDVSRLFSVRIGAGAGRVNKQAQQQAQKQRKASVGAADASHAQVIQRAAQQERELQEAARQLEEERRRFAEERQRFEQERLKVMLMLAQDMEGVKMARDGTPMYPSPANHPLLVPTEPSPIASFAASQSSFTCLPSATATATLSADALVAPHESSFPPVQSHTTSASTEAHHQSGATSNSTPSLPSLYNPSLASMPSSVAMPSADDDGSPSSSADDVDVRESAEAVPASPRKPPSGGVFLPFLMAPRAGGPQQQRNATNVSASAHQKAESEAAAELEEKLLDQLKNAEDDDGDSHVDKDAEEAESGTSSDEEEDELTDEDSTSSEEEVRVQPAVDKLMREKRKITVAPIQGISDMKGLDDDHDDDDDDDHQQQRQQLDGSWITAISPRRRERDQHQLKAAVAAVVDDDGDKEMKDVIVRPGMLTTSSSSTSVAADKSKKVSFAAGGASSWTTAESPRRMLEALRAQGASQAEIDRERRRLLAGNVADGTGGGGRALTPAAAAIATKYEEEIDQLLEKMKQLHNRSSSDDSWGDTSSDSDLDDDNVDVNDKEKQKPHDISSDDDDEEVADDDDDDSEAEVVIPEWTRGPPKSLQEMREYKDFVRARYEAEKRETERMLRRNQREMRARGMTMPSTTTASASTSHHVDHRASWII